MCFLLVLLHQEGIGDFEAWSGSLSKFGVA